MKLNIQNIHEVDRAFGNHFFKKFDFRAFNVHLNEGRIGEIEIVERDGLRQFANAAPDLNLMIEFARRYDPQPFHVDEAAAGQSVFGGLIASGWPPNSA